MLTTLTLSVAAIAVIATLIATAADRSARARAWRQIALERRWNHEQSQMSRKLRNE